MELNNSSKVFISVTDFGALMSAARGPEGAVNLSAGAETGVGIVSEYEMDCVRTGAAPTSCR